MQGHIALLAAEEHLVVLLALVEHWGTVLFLLLGVPLLSSSVDTIQCLKRLNLASSVGLQLTLFLMGSTPYLANSPRTSSCRKGSLLSVIYRIKDMIQHFQKNKSNYFFGLMVFYLHPESPGVDCTDTETPGVHGKPLLLDPVGGPCSKNK